MMRSFEISIFGSIMPSPKNMTPEDCVDELKQTVNFRVKLKISANWEGSAIRFLPNPTVPFTSLAKPSVKNVGAQVKMKFGILTNLPGFDPSVD
uniref:Uncharacterized protein n=1 Tax=Solanum lycopersicum TaxID=4081 RepID=A0A3Q7FQR5_SOLLC